MTSELDPTLNQDLEKLIDAIAEIGKDPKGGVTRLLYSKEWVDTQALIKSEMEKLELSAYYDEVGNLFGRVEGENPDEAIVTGSHVDTVKNGGRLDGQLGIAAGIIAIAYLKRKYGKPRKSLEVVSFAEEEGSRFPAVYWGSKNIFGMAKKELVADLQDADGVNFTDAMHACGFDYKDESKTLRKDIKSFVELHIEQGNVLEIEGKEIGVVTDIVGQKRFTVEITGEPNHAGTTPMGYRKNALVAASKIIVDITESAKKHGDPLVATVGYIEVTPNVVNVVPGKTTFMIDIRHTSNEFLAEYAEEVKQIIAEAAKENNVQVSVDMWMNAAPVRMDEQLVALFKEECENAGLNYRVMHSGAGHDSQIAAPKVPTAMLFVPSAKGISHHPDEYTDPKYLATGLKALINILYKLAY